MSTNHRRYLRTLEEELTKLYTIAEKARERGLDPELKPESEIAKDLAELVEGLVGPSGVAVSIRTLSEKLPREELAFKIAEEIVYGKFGHMETQVAAEQAVRTSLAVLTEGITAAPLQGLAKVSIKTNIDGTQYLAIYYAGPIRSAGGTDQALTLVTGDFVRRLLGLSRFKPSEEEINRFIEEARLYERTRGRFQYHVTDLQLRKALESIPIEVTGIKSDPEEVQTFRNLPRIETNCVRGGALRVVNDGVIGRAAKVFTIVKRLGIEGWDWLKDLGEAEQDLEKNQDTTEETTAGFMEDIIAGRPVFSFPSQSGGFRLRYGRARNTGLAAVGLHPLSMMVLDEFLAGGTQIRIELPGKGGIVMPVDTIEPPIIRLKDGSVTRVTADNYPQIKDKLNKILFLGDLLISFGDFLYNNTKLSPSGYTEEWWREELITVITHQFNKDLEQVAKTTKVQVKRLREIISSPFEDKPDSKEAVTLAKNLNIPLHPQYTYFWSNITTQQLLKLRQWLRHAHAQRRDAYRLSAKSDILMKRILESLCIPHRVSENQIILDKDEAFILTTCLSLDSKRECNKFHTSPLETIKDLCGITLRPKAPTTVGARMGRPEKAKRREMKPRVHLIFPVGLAGGPQRDLILAAQKSLIEVDLVKRRCPNCQELTTRLRCSMCGVETNFEKACPICNKIIDGDVCPICKRRTRSFCKQKLNLKPLIGEACSKLGTRQPEIVKGVKGLSNEHKIAEILEKGILRAREDLSVYKDGTVRFDVTNAPLTHFKAAEIKVKVQKLKQLGYEADHKGEPLVNKKQICELKTQDVIIPRKSGTYLVRVASFVDQLLKNVYNLAPYYNIKQENDLVGHLIIGLAPHTSVGILGRIIGFTDHDVCYAHPLWHSAKRRDCDGDEDSLMLALDTLLNFSRSYLPSKIGGMMDAPLFIIPVVNPVEVQRQAHEFDVAYKYPLELYAKTLEKVEPWQIATLVDLVAQRLGTENQYEGYGFTTPVSDINRGNHRSMYRKLKKMTDKLNRQLALAEKIQAVDAKQVAQKVLTTHFLRDISGNLRAFSTQSFRCKACNKHFRRVPLKGKCIECGGIISSTVYRGGIEKYLNAARLLIEKYDLPKYYLHRIMLVEEEIVTLFEGKKPRQIRLVDFT